MYGKTFRIYSVWFFFKIHLILGIIFLLYIYLVLCKLIQLWVIM